MPRVKKGKTKKRKHKKIKDKAKGYIETRRKSYKKAKEAVVKAGKRAYTGRKQKKRNFRKLWITRISAALEPYGISYSKFIHQLKKNNIELNRKMLSELAIKKPKAFQEIVEEVKE